MSNFDIHIYYALSIRKTHIEYARDKPDDHTAT